MKYLTSVIIILLIIFFANWAYPRREGYESLTNCIDQGYPREWCLQTPIQSQIDDGYCYCGNGQLGTYRYGDKCYCSPVDLTAPYYVENTFRDYLA